MKQAPTSEPFAALVDIVNLLNARFPEGKDPFKQISRLTEEVGELAQAVNHREGMGIKHKKYGAPDDQAFVKEVQDVLCAAIDIAVHYDLLDELQASISARQKAYAAGSLNH